LPLVARSATPGPWRTHLGDLSTSSVDGTLPEGGRNFSGRPWTSTTSI